MHPGVNGELLSHRIADLSAFPGELLVTEFDVDDGNVDDKAEDVEDFMRVAFSQPKISGIITWAWIKTQSNKSSWTKTMFEGKVDDESVPKPENCDPLNVVCNYPLNPNQAGVRWLELVKAQWNSSTTLENLDHNLQMFHGDYEISTFDKNGNHLSTSKNKIR